MTAFQKVENMAEIEQKVKANPLPFWSILATFSTFKNGSKERLHALESFSTTPNVFLGLFERFSKVENMAKIEQKVKD